jgi:SAM-dependent MidA family methyltransferase
MYNPSRSKGTLLCYHRHRINDQPFNFIGEQDITAHVNFSALALWGKEYGLRPMGYTDQSTFLLALGLTNHLRSIELRMANDPTSNKEDIFQLYKFLGEMGKKFKVLIQEKNLPGAKLMGMQFANIL